MLCVCIRASVHVCVCLCFFLFVWFVFFPGPDTCSCPLFQGEQLLQSCRLAPRVYRGTMKAHLRPNSIIMVCLDFPLCHRASVSVEPILDSSAAVASSPLSLLVV